jgi:hypothetical protein
LSRALYPPDNDAVYDRGSREKTYIIADDSVFLKEEAACGKNLIKI